MNFKIRRFQERDAAEVSAVIGEALRVSNAPDYHPEIIREMLELWNSETVQRLDGENEHILWYVTLTQQEWLSVENEIDNAQEPAIAYFCQLAGDCFEEEQETIEEPYECSNAVCAAYYHARVLQGDQSWDEAL